jgi:hypothetical protein
LGEAAVEVAVNFAQQQLQEKCKDFSGAVAIISAQPATAASVALVDK